MSRSAERPLLYPETEVQDVAETRFGTTVRDPYRWLEAEVRVDPQGRNHPAILTTTADTDYRVVPSHSFKYAAALQAAQIGPKPHLLRVETRAGHGMGKPLAKLIEEVSDMWAFAGHFTGLTSSPKEHAA